MRFAKINLELEELEALEQNEKQQAQGSGTAADDDAGMDTDSDVTSLFGSPKYSSLFGSPIMRSIETEVGSPGPSNDKGKGKEQAGSTKPSNYKGKGKERAWE
jgi:hypothetical protein